MGCLVGDQSLDLEAGREVVIYDCVIGSQKGAIRPISGTTEPEIDPYYSGPDVRGGGDLAWGHQGILVVINRPAFVETGGYRGGGLRGRRGHGAGRRECPQVVGARGAGNSPAKQEIFTVRVIPHPLGKMAGWRGG